MPADGERGSTQHYWREDEERRAGDEQPNPCYQGLRKQSAKYSPFSPRLSSVTDIESLIK